MDELDDTPSTPFVSKKGPLVADLSFDVFVSEWELSLCVIKASFCGMEVFDDVLVTGHSRLVMGQSRVEVAGEAGADASGTHGASSSGKVRRRVSLPRRSPHTGDCSPLALPLVM